MFQHFRIWVKTGQKHLNVNMGETCVLLIYSYVGSVQYDVSLLLVSLCYVIITRLIQGVTGETDQTSGECSLGETIPI